MSPQPMLSSRTASTEPTAVGGNPPQVVVAVGSPRLRVQVELALQRARIAATVVPRLGRHQSSEAAVAIVDPQQFEACGRRRSGHTLWVLCDGPEPVERVRLMAAGAERVLDARSTAELERAIHRGVPRQPRGNSPRLADLDSRAASMSALIETARRVAPARSSLLLTGETGVGKEHLARAMHAASARADRPFVTVNCAALPETLLESHLFGHVKGAFTGADRNREGFFETASGGTILLDEIGEMPSHLQVALLNVLERDEVVPVGGTRPIPIDVRVMAATNRSLSSAIDDGSFRADLFYRLNVVHFCVPALRERREDIPDLAGRALHDFRDTRPGARVEDISSDALCALTSYAWPGNVRELRNVIERAVLLGSTDTIELEDLPDPIRTGDTEIDLPGLAREVLEERGGLARSLREIREDAIEAVERRYLSQALRSTRGRIAKTAELAGIGPRSLYDKLQRYGLKKEDFKEVS